MKNKISLLLTAALAFTIISCEEEIKLKTEQQLLLEKRASFDKSPHHNDSVTGCWIVDKKNSLPLSSNFNIDAMIFSEDHKRFMVIDESKKGHPKEQIGFFQFYNNELVMEIITNYKPFKYTWKTSFEGNKMVAQLKTNRYGFLYLTKATKKDLDRLK